MSYFVTWSGDLEFDPLNYGIEQFVDYESAKDFANRMRKKELDCHIYTGLLINESSRDKLEKLKKGK